VKFKIIFIFLDFCSGLDDLIQKYYNEFRNKRMEYREEFVIAFWGKVKK